jgi:hypothetical protein
LRFFPGDGDMARHRLHDPALLQLRVVTSSHERSDGFMTSEVTRRLELSLTMSCGLTCDARCMGPHLLFPSHKSTLGGYNNLQRVCM